MEITLTPVEVRVLASLVEKELSTPEYYPMTVNALAAACNQKSNRDPVVSYDEDTVTEAIDGLQRKRLVGTAGGAYSRAVKYRHALAEALELDRPALAVLASLMLRGPQTVGELRGRTGRMFDFDSLDAVEVVLQRLQARPEPLLAQMPRRPGQKEARYAHLLSGAPDLEAGDEPQEEGSPMERLEQQVASLKERIERLEAAFGEFRRQFE